eukprot:jgi/Botrbrau1/18851/Bobra.177_2s0013.1
MPLGVGFLLRAFPKRANRALWAGKRIMFGNKISEDGGNKSRRKWLPNVQNKRLYSEVLDDLLQLRVTTTALRCIDKAGGLDEYLLNTPDHKLASELGVKLKARIKEVLERRRDNGEVELYNLKTSPKPPRIRPRHSSLQQPTGGSG